MKTQHAIRVHRHLYLDPNPAHGARRQRYRIESVIAQLEAALRDIFTMTQFRAMLARSSRPSALTDRQVVHAVARQVVQGDASLRPTQPTGDIPWDTFLPILSDHEGMVNHMYLDQKGIVTVGIGTALFTAGDAIAIPFSVQGSNTPATPDQKQAEWVNVKTATGLPPKLVITKAFAQKKAEEMAKQFEVALRNEFPGFDEYPVELKEALVDMKYQLGGNLAKFKKFRASLLLALRTHNAKYWEEAAEESYRRDAQPKGVGKEDLSQRNRWTKKMILTAGGLKP